MENASSTPTLVFYITTSQQLLLTQFILQTHRDCPIPSHSLSPQPSPFRYTTLPNMDIHFPGGLNNTL